MASALNDNFLSSNQNINQFFVWMEIKPQISCITIRDFTS